MDEGFVLTWTVKHPCQHCCLTTRRSWVWLLALLCAVCLPFPDSSCLKLRGEFFIFLFKKGCGCTRKKRCTNGETVVVSYFLAHWTPVEGVPQCAHLFFFHVAVHVAFISSVSLLFKCCKMYFAKRYCVNIWIW